MWLGRGYTRYGTVTLVRGNHTHTQSTTDTLTSTLKIWFYVIGTHSASAAQLFWVSSAHKTGQKILNYLIYTSNFSIKVHFQSSSNCIQLYIWYTTSLLLSHVRITRAWSLGLQYRLPMSDSKFGKVRVWLFCVCLLTPSI